MQDGELLRAYQSEKSEGAFTELVRRYAGLVYSTARRHLPESHFAEEATQMVFCLLVRKAPQLCNRASLAGWLHRATCLTATKLLRTERRRRAREREAVHMSDGDSVAEEVWTQLAPMLTDALNSLGERERLAILLRFSLRKPMREVGETLGISEAAAKMRVSRALERLRQFFSRKGIACSSTALALVLTEKSIEAVPTTLYDKILASHAAGVGATVVAPSLSLCEALNLMANVTTKKVVLAALAAAALLSSGLLVFQSVHSSRDEGNRTSPLANQAQKAEVRPGTVVRPFGRANDRAETTPLVQAATEHLWTVLRAKPPLGVRMYPSEDLVEAIGRFGRHASAAFAVLHEAATDKDPEIRHRAIAGLGRVGASVPEAVTFLWSVLRSPDLGIEDRYSALASLHNTGLVPGDIPSLAALIPGADGNLKRYLPETIASILEHNSESGGALPDCVAALLKDPRREVRFDAARALAKANAKAEGFPRILGELAAGLQGSDSGEQLMALETLTRVGPAAKPAVSALNAFAKGTDSQLLREIALRAIGAIEPSQRQQSPEIDQVLAKDEREEEWQRKFGSGDFSMDDLLTALGDRRWAVAAAVQLGQMGAAASETLPKLMQALSGQDEGPREKIWAAIQKIDPQATVARIDGKVFQSCVLEAVLALESQTEAQGNQELLKFLDEQRRIQTPWFTKDAFTGLARRLETSAPSAYTAFREKATRLDPALASAIEPGK
jgi:RNA polymerase sigma factor (sigma-70 family)